MRAILIVATVAALAATAQAQRSTGEGSVRVGERVRTFLVDLPPQYDGRFSPALLPG